MWSARPFNSEMPDPFGRNKRDDGPLSAESSKCPSCGSNIFYLPEVQGMVCRNCGNIYHPATLELMGTLGYTIEHDYTSDDEISDEDKKRHEIVCDSCGATMIADENTVSTMCPFCGSPAIITRNLTREFKPDYIIPFRIDRDTAQENVKKWLKTRKMTPWGFKSKSRLTKLTALYVPFWLSLIETDASGLACVWLLLDGNRSFSAFGAIIVDVTMKKISKRNTMSVIDDMLNSELILFLDLRLMVIWFYAGSFNTSINSVVFASRSLTRLLTFATKML